MLRKYIDYIKEAHLSSTDGGKRQDRKKEDQNHLCEEHFLFKYEVCVYSFSMSKKPPIEVPLCSIVHGTIDLFPLDHTCLNPVHKQSVCLHS